MKRFIEGVDRSQSTLFPYLIVSTSLSRDMTVSRGPNRVSALPRPTPSVVVGFAVPNLLRSSFRDVSCNSKFFGWFSGVDAAYLGDGRDAGGSDFYLYQDHAL